MVAGYQIDSVFKGKRVLITGDTGFKGSWLSLWLWMLGADVVGFALPPTVPNANFKLLGLERHIHHIDGDIRDFSSLLPVFDRFRPEFVFHVAAQALVGLSYEDPKPTFDTNIGGSINVLEAVRLSPEVRSLIYVTSDKCYRNREWIWGYRENDELGGQDPYSASKAAAELVFASYLDSFFNKKPLLGAASVRAGNVIGGGDWAQNRIVPDVIKMLMRGAPIVLRNPTATRPWQHVLEPLAGYMILAARLYECPKKYSGSWNFGPALDHARTVRDLAEELAACWGEGRIEEAGATNAPYEAHWLYLNCEKAFRDLGWRTKWNFDRTVKEVVRWYKETSAGESALKISMEMIRSYMEDDDDRRSPHHGAQTDT